MERNKTTHQRGPERQSEVNDELAAGFGRERTRPKRRRYRPKLPDIANVRRVKVWLSHAFLLSPFLKDSLRDHSEPKLPEIKSRVKGVALSMSELADLPSASS